MHTDRDANDRPPIGGLVVAIVVAAALGGALVGYAVPALTGREEVSVLELTIPIAPTSVALYAGVAVGVFLVTLLGVFRVIAAFDDLE